jgi:hypothetical protein
LKISSIGTRVGQHRDERQHRFEPRTTVGIAVGTGRTIQDRAHHFQTAIDRGRTRAMGKPRLHERFQSLIVNLLRLEMADVRLE